MRFFSSRRRHTRYWRDWSSDVCSSDLADVVVPTLADWCWLVVTDEQGRLHEVASAHRDPALRAELELYVHSMVAVMTDEAAAPVVTRTGRPLVLPGIRSEERRVGKEC